MSQDNRNRLFYGSCFALITTAFSFSIRAGILPQLGEEFNLTAKQLGFINQMWFLGFPISMILGGIFYSSLGPKRIMQFAFFSHAIGILMTIYSGGFSGLLISTLFIGIGNGCTEAACNPMIADSYEGKKNECSDEQVPYVVSRWNCTWQPDFLYNDGAESDMAGSDMGNLVTNLCLCHLFLGPTVSEATYC
jgi:MFS family permease